MGDTYRYTDNMDTNTYVYYYRDNDIILCVLQ